MSRTVAPVTYGDTAAIARFSVERYQKMIEAGILTSEDKVELLEITWYLKCHAIRCTTEPSIW